MVALSFGMIKKHEHPFYIWIRSHGLMMSHVAKQVDLHPRTLGRYLKEGRAPLGVRRAIDQYTNGAVPFDQWRNEE